MNEEMIMNRVCLEWKIAQDIEWRFKVNKWREVLGFLEGVSFCTSVCEDDIKFLTMTAFIRALYFESEGI